jgi:FkbH-like protein
VVPAAEQQKDQDVQSRLDEILEALQREPTHINYLNAHKRIKKLDLSGLDAGEEQKVRLAFLGSFTLEPLVIYVEMQSRLVGLDPEVYIAPFNQYPQEILKENSRLYDSDLDMILLLVEVGSLVGEDFPSRFPVLTDEEKEQARTQVMDRRGQLVSTLTSRVDAVTIVGNFVVPSFSPLGILDNKTERGLREFYRRLNRDLEHLFAGSRQVYILDLESLAGEHGKSRVSSPEMYYRGAFLFSDSFLPLVAKECLGYLKAIKNLSRKCIVLDLDNTLWGGIVGEDGFDGIKLGGDPTGRAYADFQRLLLSYYSRGIVLAINSKNNFEDAMRVVRDHPDMVLREDHFGSFRINWEDKVQNMTEISRDLDLGLESMVFVDDNPHERERVRLALPQVLVVDLPDSPFGYSRALEGLNDFNTLVLSEEDKRRGEMYSQRRRRKELKASGGGLDDFLRSLDTAVEMKAAEDFTIPRITSLINRANQFNLTTRRYTQMEVERMTAQAESFRVYSLRVSDRFGDEGIVGVAVIRIGKGVWTIDSFLMSCRVIGRGIETAFLAGIVEEAGKDGADRLAGEFIPTPRIEPARSFYRDHGFQDQGEVDGVIRWGLDLKTSGVDMPQWVRTKDE